MRCIDDPLFTSIPFHSLFESFRISLTFSYTNRLMKTRIPPVFHGDSETYELPNYIPLIAVIFTCIKKSDLFLIVLLYRFEVVTSSFLLDFFFFFRTTLAFQNSGSR